MSPNQSASISVAAEETILEIGKVLTSIEANLWGSPPPRKPMGKPLVLILERLNQIRLKTETDRRLSPEIKTDGALETPIVSPSLSLDPTEHAAVPQNRSFAEEFVEIYNKARENKEVRDAFWNKFNSIQIGNRNASEQRMGRTTETDFRKTDVGDFLAVKNDGPGTYLVVPHFTLVIDDTSFRFGGVDAAFECDFSPGESHQQFKVIKTAEFVNDGDTWTRRSRGRLQFID